MTIMTYMQCLKKDIITVDGNALDSCNLLYIGLLYKKTKKYFICSFL